MKKLRFVQGFWGIALASCSFFVGDMSSKGIVVDVTASALTVLADGGDTLSFGMMEADRTHAHGLLIGDTVEVFYSGGYSKGMPADSLVLHPRHDRGDDALGPYLVRTYEGILPAASCPGIRYTLTVRNREHSGDGTFSLALTYMEAENGRDSSFLYTGKRFTQRGTPDDNDATVWQFVADDGGDTFNFLVESDSALVLLNDRFERSDSKQSHTLVRIR